MTTIFELRHSNKFAQFNVNWGESASKVGCRSGNLEIPSLDDALGLIGTFPASNIFEKPAGRRVRARAIEPRIKKM